MSKTAPANKICLITGASSGIGYYTALKLAQQNCEVTVICRDKTKTSFTVEQLVRETNNKAIHGFWADLADKNEIERVAREIKSEFDHIDVLIHNAACVSSKFQLTKQKIELQFAVNHVAPFLLTYHLLPLLNKSNNGRIITVSSRAHSRATVNFDDLFTEKYYDISRAYNQSKLANLMFIYTLARKLNKDKITANAFHPGLVNSDFGNKNVSFVHDLFWQLVKRLGKHPSRAAKDAVYLALSDDVSKTTGGYFHNKKQISSSRESNDTDKAQKLWDITMKMCGLNEFFHAGVSEK